MRYLLASLVIAGAANAGPTPTRGAVVAATSAAATVYRIINLGPGTITEIPAINASDQVAFSLDAGRGSHAFFHDGVTSHEIGASSGADIHPVALNNAGQVVGWFMTPAGIYRAFVWRKDGSMVDIGTLPGAANAAATAINSLGVVVGTSGSMPLNPLHAFRWSAATGMKDLGTLLPGFPNTSSAVAINDAGLIAGVSDASAGTGHAVVWTWAGGPFDIDTLGSTYSYSVAVSAKGEVAGHFFNPRTKSLYHAFLWSPPNGMRDLGTANGIEAFVLAMSQNAQIAGVINLANGNQHAMSWTRAGGMVDLGTLGGSHSRALAINNKGQVVGHSHTKRGDVHAFLWSAARGMVDVGGLLGRPPSGLQLDGALAISDKGSIVASSNAGLVLLKICPCQVLPHAVGPVTGAELIRVGAPLNAAVGFADENLVGTRSVSWSWGDGSPAQAAVVRESGGAGSASGSHSYAEPGIYAVTATVVNGAGQSTTVSRKIVVYESSGGVIGGSGAFMSPQGALRTAPMRAGKARFHFIAPLKPAAPAASTKAQLHFDIPGLSFRSENVRPMAEEGAGGRFGGSGSINGAGDYKFILATTVGAATEKDAKGRLGLKIWHIDPASKAEVVDYDNLSAGTRVAELAGAARVAGSAIVEGRIVQE